MVDRKDLITLYPSMCIRDAIDILLENGISGAPVVDPAAPSTCMGILTETDVMWKEAGVPQDHYVIPPFYLPFLDATLALRNVEELRHEVGHAQRGPLYLQGLSMLQV